MEYLKILFFFSVLALTFMFVLMFAFRAADMKNGYNQNVIIGQKIFTADVLFSR